MEYIGLNGKECENPRYYCKSHEIYLSEDDVSIKRCFCKDTPDMNGAVKCNWLISIEDREKEALQRNSVSNEFRQREYAKKRLQNSGIRQKTTYQKTVERLIREQKKT